MKIWADFKSKIGMKSGGKAKMIKLRSDLISLMAYFTRARLGFSYDVFQNFLKRTMKRN